MSYLDQYLKKEHEDAAEDFDKGEDKDGKDADDKLGAIHDLLTSLDQHLKDIHAWMSPKEEVKEAKEVATEEQDKVDEKPEKGEE